MQFELALLAAALATLGVATSSPRIESASSCATGSIQCCRAVKTSAEAGTDPTTVKLLALIGVAPADLTGDVGITCSAVASSGTW